MNWQDIKIGNLRIKTASNLSQTGLVKHGFSTRLGGVSKNEFAELNPGLSVADNYDDVIENRRILYSSQGIDYLKIIVPEQVHGDSIAIVNESHAGLGAINHGNAISETDALVTNVLGITLALHFADCGSIFLLDPVNRAIGLAHAGWRGTVKLIAGKTVEVMSAEYGTKSSDVIAALGPCISRCCFRVNSDVYQEFETVFGDDSDVYEPSEDGGWMIDIKKANTISLMKSGVLPENICICQDCTCCNTDYFSYRRQGPTGRMAGWIALL